MDLTTSMRVGAVGNAFCAFSKELVGAFCASTAPAASTRRISSGPSPYASGFDAVPPFIETHKTNGPEMEIPNAVVDGLETDVLVRQYGADGQHPRLPGDGARGTDAAEFVMPRILHRAEMARHGAWRFRIEAIRRLLRERFMRTFV